MLYLFLNLVFFNDKPFYLKEVLGAFFYFSTAKLALNKCVSSIAEMENGICL